MFIFFDKWIFQSKIQGVSVHLLLKYIVSVLFLLRKLSEKLKCMNKAK